MDRCEGIVTEEGDKKEEMDAIKGALTTCGYPEWTMTTVKTQMDNREERAEEKRNKKKGRQNQDKSRGMVILPYVKGLSEKVARMLKKRKVNAEMRLLCDNDLHTPRKRLNQGNESTTLTVKIVKRNTLVRQRECCV